MTNSPLVETTCWYALSRLRLMSITWQRARSVLHLVAEHAADRLHSPDASVDGPSRSRDNLRSVLGWCETKHPPSGLKLASMLVDILGP